MKGIVLAGGSGTRLFPITKGASKQILPLYDKPMVYYPISALMLAGIRDILIITTPQDQSGFQRLLGDGSNYGVNFTYAVQPEPKGLAQAFTIAEDCGFAKEGEPLALVLGDNIFHGARFTELLNNAVERATIEKTYFCDARDEETGKIEPVYIDSSATVFGYYVNDPERYGVAEFNENGHCLSIEEKPKNPKSNYAVVGLYFYPGDVIEKAKQVQPSGRGELEITTLNQMYLAEDRLVVEKFPRGFAWLDTGTFDSLSEASNYVETIEKRTGLMVACLEEIAFNNKWINRKKLLEIAKPMEKNEYGQYLIKLANGAAN